MATPVRDEQFDAVSILYHALQGANTCSNYIKDAQQSGDKELQAFFNDVNSHYQEIASRAKEVVKQRLG